MLLAQHGIIPSSGSMDVSTMNTQHEHGLNLDTASNTDGDHHKDVVSKLVCLVPLDLMYPAYLEVGQMGGDPWAV